MFVLQAPVISFNPKAFFYDKLFRQCFPKLPLISTDPERASTGACVLGLLRVDIFWLKVVPKERIQNRCFFLWAGSDAGTTLRFADV